MAFAGQFVQPEIVATHFHLHDGDSVADFGAGAGHYLAVLSKLVGPEGRVYACEIQKPLVDKLGIMKRDMHIANLDVVWCDLESPGGTKLGDGILDAALLSNTLFQLENKEIALAEVARVVRRGGKLFIIDWTDSFGGMGPHPSHVVTESMATELAQKAGFAIERTIPAGDHHYGLALRRV